MPWSNINVNAGCRLMLAHQAPGVNRLARVEKVESVLEPICALIELDPNRRSMRWLDSVLNAFPQLSCERVAFTIQVGSASTQEIPNSLAA